MRYRPRRRNDGLPLPRPWRQQAALPAARCLQHARHSGRHRWGPRVTLAPAAALDRGESSHSLSRDTIYQRPDDYNLEHASGEAEEDSGFYCRVLRRLQPGRILELGCGTGRVTLALAAALPDSRIVGLDSSPDMLARAEALLESVLPAMRSRVTLESGDMRTWNGDGPFDVVVMPCCAASHLLTMSDRLSTWQNCFNLLKPQGTFLLDVGMPDLATLAESQRIASRALLQLDVDASSGSKQTRLLRSRATIYQPHEQRADIRFFYDRFDVTEPSDRFVSNFASHVYFPSEIELLFATTGFSVMEHYGAYDASPFGRTSPYLITLARRP